MSGTTAAEARKYAIERWAAYWSRHDAELLLSIFSDDVVYEDVPMGVVSRGRTEVKAFAGEVWARVPGIRFELRTIAVDAGAGAAEWIMRGSRMLPGVPEGRRFQIRGVSVFEFSGDKISRCSDYWDMGGYLEQLGLKSIL